MRRDRFLISNRLLKQRKNQITIRLWQHCNISKKEQRCGVYTTSLLFFYPLEASNACKMSPIMSALSSKPTDIRTVPGIMPKFNLSSSLSLACVVEAGCVAMERTSPKFDV